MIWGDTEHEHMGEVGKATLRGIGDSPKAICASAATMLRGGRNTPGLLPFVEAAFAKHGSKKCQRVVWVYATDLDFIQGKEEKAACPSIRSVQLVFEDIGFRRGLELFAQRWTTGK